MGMRQQSIIFTNISLFTISLYKVYFLVISKPAGIAGNCITYAKQYIL
jgi:hypothetical protein